MSFVSQGKGPVLVLKGLWPKLGSWLLNFCIAQDDPHTKPGTTAHLAWFDSAKLVLQTAIMNLGRWVLFGSEKGQ